MQEEMADTPDKEERPESEATQDSAASQIGAQHVFGGSKPQEPACSIQGKPHYSLTHDALFCLHACMLNKQLVSK